MRRFLPLTVFLTIGLIGLVGASTAWLAVERAERVRFAAVADEAANRVRARIAQHEMLIAATAAYFEASHETVTTGSFATYFGMLGLDALSPGISHLGFAPLGTVAEAEALAVEYGATGFRPFVIWPEPIEATVAPITLLGATEPVPSGMIGFDMHSEPRRRVAMEAAIQARAPRATEPIAIMPGEEARAGFIVFAPVYTPRMERVMRISTQHYPAGFVFAGFRTSDLLQAALHVEPILPVHVTLRDAAESRTTVRETAVYAYGRQPDPGYGQDFAELRQLAVAGRVWQAELRPTAGFRPGSGRALSIGLLVAALVLAGTIAFSLREQARARSAAEVLAAATQRNLGEKDMMLQEMKHRIKNAIARILGIARQTAAHSSDIESFSSSFTQRLQAMAAAQDVLTRSRYQRAELRELLSHELAQVFGEMGETGTLTGPPVELGERVTQALGLVFHELATNALKYGGADDGGATIAIAWALVEEDGREVLRIDWREAGGEAIEAPKATGFGTRLIDANIRHELGGRVERDFLPSGLAIRLWVPLEPAP